MSNFNRITFRDDLTGKESEYIRIREFIKSELNTENYTLVNLLEEEGTGQRYVLKEAYINDSNDLPNHVRLARQVRNEVVDALDELELARIIGVSIKEIEEPSAFSPTKVLSSIQTYAPGDCIKKMSVDNSDIIRVIDGVSDIVSKLIAHGVVHCDLKPGNIVVDRKRVSLIDIEFLHTASDAKREKGTQWRGTHDFIAPEVWRGITWERTRDVYSLGITAILIGRLKIPHVFARNLFNDPNYKAQFEELKQPKRYELLKGALLNNGKHTNVPGPVKDQVIRFASHALAKAEARPTTYEEMTQILHDSGNIAEL